VKSTFACAATAVLVALLATPLTAAAPPKTFELGHGPTIVILHDLAGSALTWMPTVRKLTADHRVVLIDMPGHGESPLPDPFSLEAVAAGVDQILAKQNPDSTVLLASGMGGLVALIEMRAHPERVRGLIVIDAAAKPPFKVSDQQLKTFFDFIDQHYDDFLLSTYGRLGRDSLENVEIHAQAAQAPPLTVKSYLRAALMADGAQTLKTLKKPFLFVATDRILAGQDWPTTAKAIGYDDPAAMRVRLLHNTGYLVMKREPDSLVTVIHEFEAKLPATTK
jgi:pimeloyl-ACP methyl ester carboxylesterase